MPLEKVWIRFEGKKKDGIVLKLRIQDLPTDRNDEIIGMMLKYYARDEPAHKALGIIERPKAMEAYMQFLEQSFIDPSLRVVICCSDDSEEVTNIMAASILHLDTNENTWGEWKKEIEELGDEAAKKLFNIFYDCALQLDPVKEYKLDSYYDDRAVIVLPEYRGLGIAESFFKVRRLMCEAHGVEMTGAWMTAYGTQKAAAKDGWETVSEMKYEDLGKKYGITFNDVPPTMKFMVTRPNKERIN